VRLIIHLQFWLCVFLFLLVFFDSQVRISLLGEVSHAHTADNLRRHGAAIAGSERAVRKLDRFVSCLHQIDSYRNLLEDWAIQFTLDVIIVHDLRTSGLCRIVAQLCGPVPRRHKG
jgi:hypothetical protein